MHGAVNTGGGGGGGSTFQGGQTLAPCGRSKYASKGGSGIVVLRSPAGYPMSVSPGTNSVTTVCGQTVAKFTVSGTLTLN